MSLLTDKSVDLHEVLTNKENRVKRQQEWLKSHSLPLVSFSINMPGPNKNNPLTQTIFEHGINAVIETCVSYGWPIITRQITHANTGPEAIFVVEATSASWLKMAMMKVEHTHKLGRLMDIDVLDTEGKIISRAGQRMARRKCLICDKDAVICARSNQHDLDTLLTKIKDIVENV